MRASTTCTTCQGLRLRLFLSLALPLIAMIYLQPEGAVRLATAMPGPDLIGWGIALACGIGFGLRLRAWRREAGR